MQPVSILPPPIPLRYTLSSIEPQRLIAENEELRKINLDLELSHQKRLESTGEIEGLKAEVEYLRTLSNQRLNEVQRWQEISNGLRSPCQIEALKTQIERSVCHRLDEDMKIKLREYSNALEHLKAENIVLMKNNMKLQEELERLKRESALRETHLARSMEHSVSKTVLEEKRRIEEIHKGLDRKNHYELVDLKNQVSFLQRELEERESQIKKLNREYVENVVTRKQLDLESLNAKYRAELDLAKLDHHKLIDELATGNRELQKRVAELESALARQRIDHSAELEQLKSKIF